MKTSTNLKEHNTHQSLTESNLTRDLTASNRTNSQTNRNVTRAIILVGGWGTRLRPLTYTMPKPLVPFCNRPMLKYQIDKLVIAGVREVVLAVNYYSELIMKECEEYEHEYGIKIVYSKEDYPMGTGGPLGLAREYLRGSAFFVMNSDICSNANLVEMKEIFMNGTTDGMIMTYPVNNPSRYGLVETCDDFITSFTEKPEITSMDSSNKVTPSLINAGIYIFTDKILEQIELKEVSLERDIFPGLAKEKQLVHYKHNGYWMDIGQIQDYLAGQKMCLDNENLEELESDWQADQNKETESSVRFIREKNVVIGRNVVIGKDVVLENCAIFDGVKIGDNSIVKNSIIGWDCVIGNNCFIEDVSALGKGVSIESNINIKAMRINPTQFVTAGANEEK